MGSDRNPIQSNPDEIISIHAPRVGSDLLGDADKAQEVLISIHAPRVGSDSVRQNHPVSFVEFLSTLPAWGATEIYMDHEHGGDISIHAPRVGSDAVCLVVRNGKRNFYPRSPRGERLLILYAIFCNKYFYPRSPRGERPIAEFGLYRWDDISIHAPRVGSDHIYKKGCADDYPFLSTLPAWGATGFSISR